MVGGGSVGTLLAISLARNNCKVGLYERNVAEMSHLSGDPKFQLRKGIEAKFSNQFPSLWKPLYSMVTFSPAVMYSDALRIGDRQEQIMSLPNIEDDWGKQIIMDQLLCFASAEFGDTS